RRARAGRLSRRATRQGWVATTFPPMSPMTQHPSTTSWRYLPAVLERPTCSEVDPGYGPAIKAPVAQPSVFGVVNPHKSSAHKLLLLSVESIVTETPCEMKKHRDWPEAARIRQL